MELKAIPLFSDCSETTLEELLASPHRRRVYVPGKTVMQQGDAVQSLILLTSGCVETRMGGEEGREVVMDCLSAPCLLAPAFLFASDSTLPVEVTAIEECIVWTLNREGFLHFMAAHPEVMSRFLRMISDRSRFLSEKVRTFALKGLRNRVLDYLRTHGDITHITETAECLGVTRPSLSRVLSEMVKEGAIKYEDKTYSIV